ncbi:MAG: hypothetical protein EOO04_07910 [Chitinophagaceae bacterium]|nr:MAG: hypothetical protein EOO04_07910 [Chitinophagaceae bacterium]
MVRLLISVLILLCGQQAFTQSVSGSWYGKADVNKAGVNNNYLTELVITQKGDEVTGIFGYYFKDSYQSFYIRGTYDKKTRQVVIKNLPVIFYGSTSARDGIECPMSFQGTLLVSKVENSLKGSFQSIDKYKYTCPEIRVDMSLDVAAPEDSILKTTTAGKKFWTPQVEDYVVTSAVTNKPVTVSGDVSVVANEVAASNAPARLDSIAEKELIKKFESRKNIYSKDLEIEGDSIRVSFYDNGDIDGDSISVFLNNAPVLAKHFINDRALNIFLALDSTKDINELGMFADNLGKIPPNTALMVITDGINRYEVYMSASLTQNSTVRLKRKKKATAR